MILKARFTAVVCAWLLLALPIGASAHTHFQMSEPAPDETLSSAPQKIRLWFSAPVESDFSRIEVTDAGGTRVDKGSPARASEDPKILEVAVPDLQPGKYHVEWNVVSGDGHRVKGDFSFSVK